MQPDFDVAIVGAGPAGSVAARELARVGCKVAIFEKERLPRHKTCGGGLTARARQLLGGLDLADVVEDEVYGVKVSYQGRNPYELVSSDPLIYMVMRNRLDYRLAQEAVRAGAELYDERPALSLDQWDGLAWVHFGDAVVTARYVLAADGVYGMMARRLGLAEGREWALALEVELPVSDEEMAGYRGTAHVDYGACPRGYGWIFPKADHLSVGVGGLVSDGRLLRQRLDQYLQRQGLDHGEERLIFRGYPLSAAPGQRLHAGRIAVLGDAAGLVDPWWGEGMYFAIWSGQLAAEAVRVSIENGWDDLRLYEDLLNASLLPELEAARWIAQRFYKVLPGLHPVICRFPNSVRPLLDVMTGRRDMRWLKGEVVRRLPLVSGAEGG